MSHKKHSSQKLFIVQHTHSFVQLYMSKDNMWINKIHILTSLWIIPAKRVKNLMHYLLSGLATKQL